MSVFVKLVHQIVVYYLYIGSLHSAGMGFYNAGAFEFSYRIYDNGSCYTGFICYLAGNKETFIILELIEDLDGSCKL